MEWAYQCYNIAYSCFPIFAYTMFDKDAEDADLESNPDIYYLTNGTLIFFCEWLLWIKKAMFLWKFFRE